MKKYLPFYIAFLIICLGCSEKPWLSGTVEMPSDSNWKPMVYLVQPNSWSDVAQSFVGQVLDSAEVRSDGSFRFKKPLIFDKPVLLEVTIQQEGEKYPNRLAHVNPETDNYFPLVVSVREQITVRAKMGKFQSTFEVIHPSKANAEIMRLQKVRTKAYKDFIEPSEKENKSDEQLLEKEKAVHEYQSRLMHFADATQEVLPALVAIKWASPEGDFERIPELLFQQSQKWAALVPNHPWVKELGKAADKGQLPILVGDAIPNLSIPMKTGDVLHLNEVLNNKKLLLLDVWASWCAPCRVENRNVLVPLWEKYHTSGFEILAYGLESSPTAWDKAIERDGAYRWLHASHLKGDQNPFMEALRLRTIPANFLLDGNGKVLAKNLHGDELMAFFDNYIWDN